MTTLAGMHGRTADINLAQDNGFMYGRNFTDPNGNVWEPVWMEPTAIPAAESAS